AVASFRDLSSRLSMLQDRLCKPSTQTSRTLDRTKARSPARNDFLWKSEARAFFLNHSCVARCSALIPILLLTWELSVWQLQRANFAIQGVIWALMKKSNAGNLGLFPNNLLENF